MRHNNVDVGYLIWDLGILLYLGRSVNITLSYVESLREIED